MLLMACEDVKKAELEEAKNMLLMVSKYAKDAKQEKEEISWFLDLGCSNHMCGNNEWFLTLMISLNKL